MIYDIGNGQFPTYIIYIYILYLQNSIDVFSIKASIKIAFFIATLDDTGGYPYLGNGRGTAAERPLS